MSKKGGGWSASFSIDIRHLRFDKSALTKHVFDNEHSVDWANAKILNFELDFAKRRFIESYFINQIPNTMNDKQNGKFPSIYSATLRGARRNFFGGGGGKRRIYYLPDQIKPYSCNQDFGKGLGTKS